MRFSKADYDKPYRCPGRSGAGWKYNKDDWCHSSTGSRWSTFVYEYGWTVHLFRVTRCCHTVVLPLWLKWLEASTWAWEFEKWAWEFKKWRNR